MADKLHSWATVERNGRWVSVCVDCGTEQDIHNLTTGEIYALPDGPCPGRCPHD